jgi:hypothetical protein
MASMIMKIDLDDVKKRFYSKIRISEAGCHEWIGARQSNGYGRFNLFRESMYAHRVAALFKYGVVYSHLDVCHKCDNRRCVNPEHLFVGTRLENMQDAVRKGRQAKGNKLPNCKITSEKLAQIIQMAIDGLPYKEIANKFMVSRYCVNNLAIKNGVRRNGISK